MALTRPSPNNVPPPAPEGMRWVWHAAGAEWVLDAALSKLSWWELNRGDIPYVLRGWAKALAIIVAVVIAFGLVGWYISASSGPPGRPDDNPYANCTYYVPGGC